jgi:hypothetical protein
MKIQVNIKFPAHERGKNAFLTTDTAKLLNFVGTAKNGEGKLGWRDKEILRISSQKILRIEVELSRQL